MGQRGDAADGPAARPAGADRVLRLLPRLVAAHVALRARLARALRRRRAARRSVHAPGYEPGRDAAVVRDAVGRLGIEHPVCLDPEFELWQLYGNEGWPARYLFDGASTLTHFHYGEGAYAETERAIQALLGADGDVLAPLRPEDDPDALIAVPTPEQPGAYCGPYEAGAAWAVLSGAGTVRAGGAELRVEHPGAHLLVEHPHHTAAVLELEIGAGVTCHATCFTPGLAPG